MKSNYYALLACIMNAKLTVEKALHHLGLHLAITKPRESFDDNSALAIIEMRSRGVMWKDIADRLGISTGAAFRRMKYYQEVKAAQA